MMIDTTFLLDLMQGRERAVALLEDLEKENEPLALATITLQEFTRGLHTTSLSSTEQRRVREVVHGRPLFALDAAAAERAGEIDAALWERGDPLDPEDAAIAGIALTRDEILVTRRAKEFGRVPGLRLRTY